MQLWQYRLLVTARLHVSDASCVHHQEY